ncbi:MAG: hypothetical protein K2P09_01720 [Erysipelotrichales bacterium]|nr:hypothetical protein [Erysipelotrichales bacterium]
MSIEVKGINNVLMLKCDEKTAFHEILNDLSMLLDQPLFNQEGYYPKAFFDFGCRQLNEFEVKNLIELIYEKKKILFEGLSIPKTYHHIQMKKEQIRNGEECFVYQSTLFLGVVNAGSYVYCFEDVYFLNEVKGTIIAMNSNVKIYGHHFTHAKIMINRKTLHDVTTSAFTSVYYKDDDIVCMKEDVYDKNHRFNFG